MKSKHLFISAMSCIIFSLSILPIPSVMLLPSECRAQTAAVTPYEGKLSDGRSSYSILVPSKWNGTVFVTLDALGGLFGESDIPVRDWLLNHGYAVAGTDRKTIGWNLSYAAANVVEVLETFIELVGKPNRSIVWGRSRGGAVTRAVIQLYPDRFDAAAPMCGGGPGSVAMNNYKLDAAFTLDVLLGREYGIRLELNNIQDLDTELSNVEEILRRAQKTPKGRARVALAGAFSQIPVWNKRGQPEPAEDDYETQQANIAQGMPYSLGNFFLQAQENLAGGPFTWNHDVDYRAQLNKSGYKKLVKALYDKAGLDLEADLDRLAKAPRLCADSAAVSFAEKNITYNGLLQIPVLSMTTTGDMAGPISDENSYADVVRHAGKSDLLRQAFVHRCDHCNFTAGELIAVFETLMKRLDTGKWEDSATAEGLTKLVTKLQSESSLDLGGSNFVPVDPPDALRTWDVRDWGTYKPSASCRPGINGEKNTVKTVLQWKISLK